MSTTWTCASGHTHDAASVLRGLEPDATPGQECKASGDRVAVQEYATNPSGRNVSKKWNASSRSVGNAP